VHGMYTSKNAQLEHWKMELFNSLMKTILLG